MKPFTKEYARDLTNLLQEAVGIVEDLKNTRPLAYKGYQGSDFLRRAQAVMGTAPEQQPARSTSNVPCTHAEAAYWQRIAGLGTPEQKMSLR